jgi:HTH-type transcriptional regulator / antitoxin HipB
MDDAQRYFEERRKKNPEGFTDFEKGYEHFKIGLFLKQAREEAGLTQEELAERLQTKKTAISRIENHAEDIRLSTLEKFAAAVGKSLHISIS